MTNIINTIPSEVKKDIISASYNDAFYKVENYYNTGYNLNKVLDQYGENLLHTTIYFDYQQSFQSYLSWGLNTEVKSNLDGATPLNMAAGYGRNEYIAPLVDAGANVNTVDYYHYTPLLNAQFFFHYDTAQILLTYDNVNVNIPTFDGVTPLMLAYFDDKWDTIDTIIEHPTFDPTYNHLFFADTLSYDLIDYLNHKGYEADPEYMASYEAIKLLGFRYDFADCFTLNMYSEYGFNDFGYEGYGDRQGINGFLNAYQNYLDNIVHNANLPIWANDVYAKVFDAINFTASNPSTEAFLTRYLENKPILLQSGWEGHSIVLVLHGDRFYRCNRGHLSEDDWGVEEFKITHPENLTTALIHKINLIPDDPNFVLSELVETLGLEKTGHVNWEMQTAGNCVWTSLEAALESLMVTTLIDMGADNQTAHELARENYIIWENYDMALGIHDFVSHKEFMIENNLYDDILLQIFENHHDANNQYDLDRGNLILEELTQEDHLEFFKEKIGDYTYLYNPEGYQDIECLSMYEDQYGYTDWLSYQSGLNRYILTEADLNLGHEYYDFLLASNEFESSNDIYINNLQNVFLDHSLELPFQPILSNELNGELLV